MNKALNDEKIDPNPQLPPPSDNTAPPAIESSPSPSHHKQRIERDEPLDLSNATAEEIIARLNELVDSSQMHKTTHTPSCFKTDDDKRKGKCRLRFPHDLVDETSIDPATGLIRIKRNNARVADYNDYILLGMQCNTNIILIPVRENARAQVYYITAYATKIDLKNREMYALLHAPLAKYKVDAEDTATRPRGNS